MSNDYEEESFNDQQEFSASKIKNLPVKEHMAILFVNIFN